MARSRLGLRNAIRNASASRQAPRRAAKTCSRTRPRSRETRVRAETRPAARARPGEPLGVLTSGLKAVKLIFWPSLQEESSGTARVGPEADEAEPQEPGAQPQERLPPH